LDGSLSRLTRLNGVSYNLKDIYGKNERNTKPLLKSSSAVELSEKELKDKAFFEQWDKEQAEARKEKHLGFIAQDLKKVFPELVNEGKDGYMYVDYIGLIPVIVEALKEQNSIIEAQSAKIKELEISSTGSDLISIDIPVSRSLTSDMSQVTSKKISQAFLYRNSPKPFSTETEIRFFLPENIDQAYICIFDMQGTLLKKTDNLAGQSNLIIKASEFNPGMYLYSLIAEEQEVDTKRMIFTK
jgi:hypothetical protein